MYACMWYIYAYIPYENAFVPYKCMYRVCMYRCKVRICMYTLHLFVYAVIKYEYAYIKHIKFKFYHQLCHGFRNPSMRFISL